MLWDYPMLTKLIQRLPWLPLSIMGLRSVTLVVKFALALFIAQRLGVAELGIYGLVIATSIVLPGILALGLMQYQTRQFVTEPLPEVVNLIRNCWGLFILFYLILTPLALAAGWWLGQLEIAIITLLFTISEHANTDAVNTLTNRRRPLAANISFFIRGALWALILVPAGFVFPQFHTLHAILYAMLGASLLSLVIFFYLTRTWPWHKLLQKIPSIKWYRQTIAKSWHFYLSEIGNATGPMLDRYVITLFLGLEATGIYVLFWSINNAVINLVVSGSMQTRRPQLITAAHKNQHQEYFTLLKRVASQSLAITALLGFIAALVFPWIAQFLNRPEVIAQLPVLYFMLFAALLRIGGDLVAHTLYAYQKDKSFTFINFFGLPVSLLANLLFVPLLGLYGAVLAHYLTLISQFILRWWRVQPLLQLMYKKPST